MRSWFTVALLILWALGAQADDNWLDYGDDDDTAAKVHSFSLENTPEGKVLTCKVSGEHVRVSVNLKGWDSGVLKAYQPSLHQEGDLTVATVILGVAAGLPTPDLRVYQCLATTAASTDQMTISVM